MAGLRSLRWRRELASDLAFDTARAIERAVSSGLLLSDTQMGTELEFVLPAEEYDRLRAPETIDHHEPDGDDVRRKVLYERGAHIYVGALPADEGAVTFGGTEDTG